MTTTTTRTETYEERVFRLALQATDPHIYRNRRTRARLDLGTSLRNPPTEASLRRVVTVLRLLIQSPELTSVMPDTVDVRGEEL